MDFDVEAARDRARAQEIEERQRELEAKREAAAAEARARDEAGTLADFLIRFLAFARSTPASTQKTHQIKTSVPVKKLFGGVRFEMKERALMGWNLVAPWTYCGDGYHDWPHRFVLFLDRDGIAYKLSTSTGTQPPPWSVVWSFRVEDEDPPLGFGHHGPEIVAHTGEWLNQHRLDWDGQ